MKSLWRCVLRAEFGKSFPCLNSRTLVGSEGVSKMNRIRLKLAAVTMALVSAAAALHAQTDNGSIVGYVKDPSGAVVPKAKVVLKNEATGVQSRATTNGSGYYVVNSVPSGLYSLNIEAAGFKKFDSLHNK